jgi:hypothetical protein
MMQPSIIERIDRWGGAQMKLNRSEAIRSLIDLALSQSRLEATGGEFGDRAPAASWNTAALPGSDITHG